MAIWAKFVHPLPVQRSTLNPVSLLELSVQARLIWVVEMDVAVKLLGALGGEHAGVVAPEVLEGEESPDVL